MLKDSIPHNKPLGNKNKEAIIMVENKELVINGVLAAMHKALSSIQIQVLENAIREQLRRYQLQVECTELCTELDDNLYMLQVFAANKKLEGCVDKTLEQYVRSNRNFLDWGGKNYKDISKDDVKVYLASYGRGKKRNTVSNMKRYLSTFFSWLHDEGYIDKNPVKPIKGIRPELVETKYLTIEEEVAVRDTASRCCRRDIAIIDLMFSTGLRVGEMEALNRYDIDLRDGSITLKGEKSGRYRTVYLDVRAKKHLEEYLLTRSDNGEPLFITGRLYKNEYGAKEHRRLSRQAYEKLAKRICREAGVIDKDCTVHVFRKTFATRLAERGCPLEVIQELLGHADAGTTSRHYVAKSRSRIKKECERYLTAV